jgi:hypothetical protein
LFVCALIVILFFLETVIGKASSFMDAISRDSQGKTRATRALHNGELLEFFKVTGIMESV